ncbi:nucleotide disphospho-sugar-binding domain-containing protein [Streptomyces acidiscabies]|uniref:nucleotide disphospho-sugar-binding domain-containing protein n=1 Tax=Streptomyces acidiscabies TaxID=42234 RepID=UPI00073F799B|nr:nucleotide disphospho-sugar-binding domain-containing protein [Streptomyces acidiscabies]GAQ59552.1 desosaminyl transferase EryCIII precursor [Streptomyces acidiscabies]
MRVVLAVLPVKAHLNAVIPLAWALRAAGHEVVVTGDWGPEREAARHIEEAGLTAVPLGGEGDISPVRPGAHNESGFLALDPDSDDPREWDRFHEALRFLCTEVYAPDVPLGERHGLLRKLVAFTGAWRPDLVLWDMLMFPAPVAARLCGAAHGRLLWGTDTVALLRDRLLETDPATEADPATDPGADWLGRLLAPYGLEFTAATLLGDWSVDLNRPHPYPAHGTTVPVRRIPYGGPAELTPWLHEPPARPRVVLTLGMTRQEIRCHETAFPLGDFLRASSDLDIDLLVTLTTDQLSDLAPYPANVRPVGYVPFDHLLPSCSAIVHQGGRGTFATAAACRVPQIVVPQPLWDEAATARQVTAYGAGLALDLAGLDGEALRKALVRVLEEPGFREGAELLYDDLTADPPPTACVPRLEELTALHRAS